MSKEKFKAECLKMIEIHNKLNAASQMKIYTKSDHEKIIVLKSGHPLFATSKDCALYEGWFIYGIEANGKLNEIYQEVDEKEIIECALEFSSIANDKVISIDPKTCLDCFLFFDPSECWCPSCSSDNIVIVDDNIKNTKWLKVGYETGSANKLFEKYIKNPTYAGVDQ